MTFYPITGNISQHLGVIVNRHRCHAAGESICGQAKIQHKTVPGELSDSKMSYTQCEMLAVQDNVSC